MSTTCIITRAQINELPFLDAFVEHHRAIGVRKIFIVHGDDRDPLALSEAVDRRHGAIAELLCHPDNVRDLRGCFNRYIDRLRDYDHCTCIDLDELISLPGRAHLADWLGGLGDPQAVWLPWINVQYFGPPRENLGAFIELGQIVPSALSKCIFATRDVARIDPHNATFPTVGETAQFVWRTDGVSLRRAGTELREVTQLRRHAGASHARANAVISDPSGFAFIAHFNVRGSADALAKSLYQNFRSTLKSSRSPDHAAFDPLRAADLPVDGIPSRFGYAYAARHGATLPPAVEAEWRHVLRRRIAAHPIDTGLQRRILADGLEAAGLTSEDAWRVSDGAHVQTLFDALEARHSALFARAQGRSAIRLAELGLRDELHAGNGAGAGPVALPDSEPASRPAQKAGRRKPKRRHIGPLRRLLQRMRAALARLSPPRRPQGDRAARPKVLQIGFNKCATRSIHQLFLQSGYASAHYEGGGLARALRKNSAAGRPPLEGFEHFDCYTDMEWVKGQTVIEGCRFFRELHEAYPNALFILNTRRVDDWIASRRAHGRGTYVRHHMRHLGLESPEAVEAVWRRDWEDHHRAVRRFFADKPGQLLEFDIDRDDGRTLAAFVAEHYRLDPAEYGHYGSRARRPEGRVR